MCAIHLKYQKNPGNDFPSKGVKLATDQDSLAGKEVVSQEEEEELITLKEELRVAKEELFLLREENQYLQSAFENTFLGIAIIDLKGRFIQVNQALCSITGYDAEELLTKTHRSIIHANDRKSYETIWEKSCKK